MSVRLLVLAMGLVALPAPAEAQDEALFDKVRPAVVTLFASKADGEVLGTGFLVRSDGLVATAQHVVRGAERVVARFATGRTARVIKVVEENPQLDFALLQIEGDGYPIVELGSDAVLRQGQRILTLGNPHGLEFTASDGMVSALRPPHFQFTAPISPGNSGGPVFDSKGQVVGIAVFKRKDGENLNFALGIDRVKHAITQTEGEAAEAGERWFVVTSEQEKRAQAYNIADDCDPESMGPWIDEQWKQGYTVTHLAEGNNRWIVMMEQGSGLERQFVKSAAEFPEVALRQKWGEGFFLTHAVYGCGHWILVMSKAKSIDEQVLIVDTAFPHERIEARMAEGFRLHVIAGDPKHWYVTMSRGLPYSEQVYSTFSEAPRDWIQGHWAKGLYLTTVGANGTEWVAVMSRGGPITAQSWWSGASWPADWVREQWNKGWLITGFR